MNLNKSLNQNYGLTEEEIVIRTSVRDFAEQHIKPLRRKLDKEEKFSYELTKKMAEMGLFGMYLPTEYGGNCMSTLQYIIAVEELARVSNSQAATLLAHNSLGIGPIYNYGTEDQKKYWLPKLCGNHLWGFGLTEPEAGSDALHPLTTAHKEGDFWVLNGQKHFITNASTKITLGSTILAVIKEGERELLTTFLVPQKKPGFNARPMHHKGVWRASNTSELFLTNVRVPDSNILGEIGQGHKIMMQTLDNGRLSVAAAGLGLAQGAFEIALQYAIDRKQFGKCIGSNQAIGFKLSKIATDIMHARMFLYETCRMKDRGDDFALQAAMTKLVCTELAESTSREAVHIHGGTGLMYDTELFTYFTDAKILTIGEGTSEIQNLVIARKLGLPVK